MILALTIWAIGAMFIIGMIAPFMFERDMGLMDRIESLVALCMVAIVAWPLMAGIVSIPDE